jgi:translation initiation factor 1
LEQLDEETGASQSLVHIRLQQRNARKTITTIQGLDDKNDLGRLVQHFKKVQY